jgi:hypothetical protein
MKRKKVIEEIGWAGATAIIISYALTSFHVIGVDSVFYHGLNLVGAAGIIVLATSKHTEQAVVVGSVRGLIAAGSLAGIFINSFRG